MIAIIGRNKELGYNNKLIWNIPADLTRFREKTRHHPVIMGRKTFESIGHPLPDRPNIVISRHDYRVPGVTVVPSVEKALAEAVGKEGSEETFVIGGATVYEQAIDKADRLYLTVVDDTAQADAFFPDYNEFTKVVSEEKKASDGYTYTYLTLER